MKKDVDTTAATEAWGSALIHRHPQKAGKRPRAWDAKSEEKIAQAAPSHGVHETSKPNTHGRKYNPYHHGKKVYAGGDEHDA